MKKEETKPFIRWCIPEAVLWDSPFSRNRISI